MVGPTPSLTIGPTSVGYRLTEQALVFGGDVLTVTDVAVAAGLIDLGDRARVAALPAALVNEALARIRAMIEEGVDRMKTDAGDAPLIAVGGGSFLVPARLAGVSEVLNVPHQAVANAVGAAIAQVSGEVDQIFQDLTRDEAIARARRPAEDKAVAAGADRGDHQRGGGGGPAAGLPARQLPPHPRARRRGDRPIRAGSPSPRGAARAVPAARRRPIQAR